MEFVHFGACQKSDLLGGRHIRNTSPWTGLALFYKGLMSGGRDGTGLGNSPSAASNPNSRHLRMQSTTVPLSRLFLGNLRIRLAQNYETHVNGSVHTLLCWNRGNCFLFSNTER